MDTKWVCLENITAGSEFQCSLGEELENEKHSGDEKATEPQWVQDRSHR